MDQSPAREIHSLQAIRTVRHPNLIQINQVWCFDKYIVIDMELADGSLQLIDGHLRAETTPDAEVPVLVTDLTEQEADKVLLTLDPLVLIVEDDLSTRMLYREHLQHDGFRTVDAHNGYQAKLRNGW